MSKQHKIWMSPELKEQLESHWRADRRFKGDSDLLRTILVDITQATDLEAQLADSDSNGKASARVWASDELWDAATAAAAHLGLSIHSTVRRMLIKMIGD